MENIDVNNSIKFPININYDLNEEKPIEPPKLIRIEKDDNNPNTKLNFNSLNQRLLEKIKVIKNYEKELKDKNTIIDRLSLKLDKQKEEITKLNEKLLEKLNEKTNVLFKNKLK